MRTSKRWVVVGTAVAVAGFAAGAAAIDGNRQIALNDPIAVEEVAGHQPSGDFGSHPGSNDSPESADSAGESAHDSADSADSPARASGSDSADSDSSGSDSADSADRGSRGDDSASADSDD